MLLEAEFLNRLKDEELEAIQLQAKVLEIQEAKAELLDCIVAAEEEILVWERKIQLAKVRSPLPIEYCLTVI